MLEIERIFAGPGKPASAIRSLKVPSGAAQFWRSEAPRSRLSASQGVRFTLDCFRPRSAAWRGFEPSSENLQQLAALYPRVRLPSKYLKIQGKVLQSRRAHLRSLLSMAALAGVPDAAHGDDQPIPQEGIGHRIKHVSYSDIGGRPDTVPILSNLKHLYVRHTFIRC